ncbi:ATP-dependent RNA helicase [Spironucleus salmonicida]|uniref:ATP-dependent RNA helicase n=1 Tax=Spironucleus salmonicida TaxID=348837 RepID=V6LE82_9EUKA|nr:ATP-dependent RNA helicase [Spironucleus salmonicida]|eukprot:EST42782.1 ATP-dependent RNA helicase [Spironucleus salmonicida]
MYPRYFAQLNLTENLQTELTSQKFTKLTPVQAIAIPEIITGNHVSALARVGSGKTLAYLIPILHRLTTSSWSLNDGLGALILAPTRELAMQIFTVLQKVGKHLDLSAGLLIGGHDVAEQAQSLSQMNILISTPGRLCQHLSTSYGALGDGIKFIVLDEVDQLLELGFQKDMKQIFDYFPEIRKTKNGPSCQILLFSATEKSNLNSILKKLTRKITKIESKEIDLALFQAKDDKQEIAAPALRPFSTILSLNLSQNSPKNLQNVLLKTHENDKLDVLFSLLKSYQQSKFIVFLATTRQVQFFYEVIKQLHPAVLVLKLSGRLKQNQRQEIFFKFVKQTSAILLTTDVSARGLDITKIDFVVQFDLSNDANTFIHRAGRAGRMENNGVNIILQSEFEQPIIQKLEQMGVKMCQKNMKLAKACSIRESCQMIISKDDYVKVCCEKAFGAWMKSLILSGFDCEKIDFQGVRRSWGLSNIIQDNIKKLEVTDSSDDEFVPKSIKTELNTQEQLQVTELLSNVNIKHLEQFEQKDENFAQNSAQVTDLMQKRAFTLKSALSEVDQEDKKAFKQEKQRRLGERENDSFEAENLEGEEAEEEWGEIEEEECDVDGDDSASEV